MTFNTTRDNVRVECTFDPIQYGLEEADILDTALALIQGIKEGGKAKLNVGFINYELRKNDKGAYVTVTLAANADFDITGESDLHFTDFLYT